MDLISKAINKGFILKNKDYYLWEIQKWLREKHSMHIDITTDYILYKSNKNLCFEVILKKNFIKCMEVGPLETYEEALEQGLFEALKLIK